jgi:hypothetical protein
MTTVLCVCSRLPGSMQFLTVLSQLTLVSGTSYDQRNSHSLVNNYILGVCLSWLGAMLYLMSRLPQIVKNVKLSLRSNLSSD